MCTNSGGHRNCIMKKTNFKKLTCSLSIFIFGFATTLEAKLDTKAIQKAQKKVKAVADAGLQSKAYSSYAVILKTKGETVAVSKDIDALSKRYDLSSVTKPLVGSLISAMLINQKKLENGFNSSVGKILASDNSITTEKTGGYDNEGTWTADATSTIVLSQYFCPTCEDAESNMYPFYAKISIKDLLQHRSGIPSNWAAQSSNWHQLFDNLLTGRGYKFEKENHADRKDFEVKNYVYADNNYILLGRVLQIAGRSEENLKNNTLPTLNELFRQLKETLNVSADVSYAVGNERSSDRKVADFGYSVNLANAGLFGTPQGVLDVLEAALRQARKELVDGQCTGAFCELFGDSYTRPENIGLGFEVTNARSNSTRGNYYKTDGSSMGHTGFSGVSVWMKPALAAQSSDITLVFTNRAEVNATPNESKLNPNMNGSSAVNNLRSESANAMSLFN